MIIIEWLIWWVDSLFAACIGQWYISVVRFCFVLISGWVVSSSIITLNMALVGYE